MYTSPPVGCTHLCTVFGISTEILADHVLLDKLCKEALMHDGFGILDKVSHKFSPQGYTTVFLLAESHLALHTYPEFGSLTITLYSCRGPEDGKKAITHLVKALKGTHHNIQQFAFAVDPQKR